VGLQNATIAFGGAGNLASTEKYNGSTWTTIDELLTPRSYLGGCSSSSYGGLSIGGHTGVARNEVEAHGIE